MRIRAIYRHACIRRIRNKSPLTFLQPHPNLVSVLSSGAYKPAFFCVTLTVRFEQANESGSSVLASRVVSHFSDFIKILRVLFVYHVRGTVASLFSYPREYDKHIRSYQARQ